MTLPDVIAVGDFELRRWREGDLDHLLRAIEASIDELRMWLPWAREGVPSLDAKRRALRKGETDFDAGSEWEYSLWDVATDEIVGETGLELIRPPTVAEIGYWMRTDRTGRGLATAAARAMTDVAFARLEALETIEIRMDCGNAASAAIPPKLGYSLVGEETFSEEGTPLQTGRGWIWAIDRQTWERGS